MAEGAADAPCTLAVEAALLALPAEVAAAYQRDRRSLRADIEGRVAASLATNRRFLDIEAETVAALAGRVELGPRRRLTTVESLLEAARAGAPAALLGRLDRALELARRADAGLSDLAEGGFEPVRGEQDLRAVLADIGAGLHAGVDLVVDVGNARVEATTTAYFVVAEALSNVAKHASAARVSISVRGVGEDLVVEVTDDGVGGADPDGTGLRGLATRVAEHGGRLEVTPGRRSGTTVRAVIPA